MKIVSSFFAMAVALVLSGQCRAGGGLTVFVGEKVSLQEFQPVLKENEIRFDLAFDAQYRVLQRVYGADPGVLIDFKVFDHSGEPRFSKFDTVLLFVLNTPEGNFHYKYQFYPVFRTVDGAWAGCSNTWLMMSERAYPDLQPHAIAFATTPSFSTEGMDDEELEKTYPASQYQHINGQALCQVGYSLAELIEIKRRGSLKKAFESNTP